MSSRIFKQSSTPHIMVFMTSSSDHVSGVAGLTLTITESKNGGAFNSVSPTVTDRGSGWYDLLLTASDTNTIGDLVFHITGTGADPTDVKFSVVAVDLEDAVRFGLSALPAASAGANGGLGLLDANLRLLVNVDAWRGTQPSTLNNALVQVDVERWTNLVVNALVSGRVDALATLAANQDVRNVTGDVQGKVLGGGASAITGVGARVQDSSGADVAKETGGNVSAIKAKTDNLPASPAAVGSNMGTVSAVTGDVQGKVLGGGASALTGTGVRAVDGSGNAIAPETGGNIATILSRVVGTIAAGTHQPQSGDSFARLGVPSGASIDADILSRAPEAGGNVAAIKAKTDNLPASPAAVGSNMGSVTSVTGDVGGKVLGGGAGTITGVGVRAQDGSGAALATASAVAAVQADTDDIQSRLPAALVSGRMDARVGAMAAGVIDSTVAPNLNATVSSRAIPGDAMSLITDAVNGTSLAVAAITKMFQHVIEAGLDLDMVLRILLASAAGKTTNSGQNFRDAADTKNRITGTVTGTDRTAVTLDGSP